MTTRIAGAPPFDYQDEQRLLLNPENPRCLHCGIEASEAYERSMGMYCSARGSLSGIHQFEPKRQVAGPLYQAGRIDGFDLGALESLDLMETAVKQTCAEMGKKTITVEEFRMLVGVCRHHVMDTIERRKTGKVKA